jgi:hypothetical protein
MQGIGGVLPRSSDEEDTGAASEARHSREIAELILPALLAALAQRPDFTPALTIDVDCVVEKTADGWRSPASTLTANGVSTSSTAPGAVGEGAAIDADGPAGRLIARVDAGELGTIRLSVERTTNGLAVQVAADDPHTAVRAELERASLEQALRAVGLCVASVTIIQPGGTVLAPSSFTQHLNVLDTTSEEEDPGEAAPGARRLPKRLNLTG